VGDRPGHARNRRGQDEQPEKLQLLAHAAVGIFNT
jgi:hypothetical protein